MQCESNHDWVLGLCILGCVVNIKLNTVCITYTFDNVYSMYTLLGLKTAEFTMQHPGTNMYEM